MPERYERFVDNASPDLKDELSRCILCKHGVTDVYVAPRVWNKHHKDAPADAVYVGRPSKWGNPFRIGPDGDRAEVIRKHRQFVYDHVYTSDRFMADMNHELRGKDLVCWCEPAACHADILLEIANAEG